MESAQSSRTSGSLRFQTLCDMFEKAVSLRSSGQPSARILEGPVFDLLSHLHPTKETLFQVLRLVLPHLDTKRANYMLKESKIAKLYVEHLGLPATNRDAIRFKNWKDPTKNSVESVVFSDTVFVTLMQRGVAERSTDGANSSSPTIDELNASLDSLALADQPGEKKRIFFEMIRRLSATEQRWLIRIILRDMRLGVSHTALLNRMHPSAMEFFNSTSDLEYTIERIVDPAEQQLIGDGSTGVFLFRPLQPMLAKVVDSKKLNEMFKSGAKVITEPKLDGERMMLHFNRQDNKIMYWTRNAKNYSAIYGPKFDFNVWKCVKEHVSNCIFDGEFLLWNVKEKCYVPFGTNRQFATRTDEQDGALGGASPHGRRSPPQGELHGEEDQHFCYAVFDVVFMNGESLLRLPLAQRRLILHDSIRERKTRFFAVEQSTVTSTKEMLQQLELARAHRFEGVMLKQLDSPYVPGERQCRWMKLKTDHIDGLADSVDMIVLGAFHGTKYGARGLSHFLVGVWDSESSASPRDAEAKFVTVTKVGSGYNSEELREILERLKTRWIQPTSGMPLPVPDWLSGWTPAADDRPDCYIHPRDSLVMQVIGYSFVPTKKFSFGRTLRFPRCQRLRLDKSIDDANDLHGLLEIAHESETMTRRVGAMEELVLVKDVKRGKKRKRELRNDEGTASDAGPFGDVVAADRAFGLPQSILIPSEAEVGPPLSQIFHGYEVCVLHSDSVDMSVRDVWKLAMQHGAAVVANPLPRTSLILASSASSAKVKHWITFAEQRQRGGLRNGQKRDGDVRSIVDVINLSWFRRSVDAQRVLPLYPSDFVFLSERTRKSFSSLMDPFGDLYFDDTTEEHLKESVEQYWASRTTDDASEVFCTLENTLAPALWGASNVDRIKSEELDGHGHVPRRIGGLPVGSQAPPTTNSFATCLWLARYCRQQWELVLGDALPAPATGPATFSNNSNQGCSTIDAYITIAMISVPTFLFPENTSKDLLLQRLNNELATMHGATADRNTVCSQDVSSPSPQIVAAPQSQLQQLAALYCLNRGAVVARESPIMYFLGVDGLLCKAEVSLACSSSLV